MSQHVVSSNLLVHVAHADIQIAAIGVALIGVGIAASSSPLRMAGAFMLTVRARRWPKMTSWMAIRTQRTIESVRRRG